MDLRFREARATAAEVSALDAIGLPRASEDERTVLGGDLLRSQRHRLLPALHALNDRVGWISEGGLDEICRRLSIAPAEAYGVATFYGLFSMSPPRSGEVAWVCEDLACSMVVTSQTIADAASADAEVRHSPCLGLCERAPAALRVRFGDPPRASAVPSRAPEDAVPEVGHTQHVLLARVGRADPESISSYRASGGFEALRLARSLGAIGVIRELTESGLVGRGGAAFPAGRKWDAVARHPVRPHYLVCNADESEPGTFKDRVLMECDPFAVVESIVIAAMTTGCEKAYVYLRGEYPLARARLETAIAAVRYAGLSEGIDIEVFRGAGAYICGEETAIFNSIEGFRGEPRSKPPFPVDAGLFGKPTLVNNVETLVNVLPVLVDGGRAFASVGTATSTGTKLFCVSGRVARPGVYEVPFGTSLAELLRRAGAGAVRAVLLGGAAGGFVGPDQLDMELSIEGARAVGASLGSGVVMVLDDSVDVGAFVRRVAAFFREESCGQCVPCRIGTQRQEEALLRLARGEVLGSVDAEIERLATLGQVMRDASICGLGQSAASAVQSAVSLFGAGVLAEQTR